MPEVDAASLDQKTKIEIILHEYDALRTEIGQNGNFVYQLYGAGTVGYAALAYWYFTVPAAKTSPLFWILLAVGTLLFAWGVVSLNLDVRKKALRLQEIETYVNTLSGEELLKWELYWGGLATHYFWPTVPDPSKRSRV